MNSKQIQTIINEIVEYQKLDISGRIAEKYISEVDLEEIKIGKFSALNFLALSDKAIFLLKQELQNGLGSLLLERIDTSNFNAFRIDATVSRFVDELRQSNFEEAAFHLENIILYIRSNGFWNEIYSHNVSFDNQELIKQLDIQYKIIKEVTNNVKDLVGEIRNTKQDFENFDKDSRSEIEKLYKKIEIKEKEWTEIYNSVQVRNNDIHNIYNNGKEKIFQIGNAFEQMKDSFDKFTSETKPATDKLTELINLSQNKLLESDQALKLIEGKKSFMDEKEKEIVKLTGFAADSSLGHSFQKRATTLSWSSWIWLVAIVFLLGGTAYWIFLVFTELKTETGNVWANSILNIIKTLPAFFVLGFSIRQYTKERNLQEEYQFKQAVAVTLNAYADQLENETNKERIDLLRKTIDKLYTPPKIVIETNSNIGWLRSRPITETVKTLSDTIVKLTENGKKA